HSRSTSTPLYTGLGRARTGPGADLRERVAEALRLALRPCELQQRVAIFVGEGSPRGVFEGEAERREPLAEGGGDGGGAPGPGARRGGEGLAGPGGRGGGGGARARCPREPR